MTEAAVSWTLDIVTISYSVLDNFNRIARCAGYRCTQQAGITGHPSMFLLSVRDHLGVRLDRGGMPHQSRPRVEDGRLDKVP